VVSQPAEPAAAAAAELEAAPESTNWPPVLLGGLGWAWLGVSGLLLLRLGSAYFMGRTLLRQGRPVQDPILLVALDAAARRLGLHRPPRLLASPLAQAPVVWGWGRPVVVVPSGLLSPLSPSKVWESEVRGQSSPQRDRGEPENGFDWEAIFAHELAHLMRRDHWSALLAELVVAILPWQPLAWEARRRLALYCEYAADDWALAAGRSAPDYAAALLALGVGPSRRVQPGLLGAGGFLPARLRRILRGPRAIHPQLGRSWTVVAVGLTLLLTTGLALAQDHAGRPDSFVTQPHPVASRMPLP
jgi:beta-lactamase regulating signal transducer with metallopeptidase domain